MDKGEKMSEPKTFEIPEATCIRLVNPEGDTILESEVVYIDDLLSKAQEGVDSSSDKSVVQEWLPKFKELLDDHFECELADTDAYFIAREATKVMWSIKKKFDSTLTS